MLKPVRNILFLLLGFTAMFAQASQVEYYPRELNTRLHNPHMGWYYIDNCYPGVVDAGRSLPYIQDGTAWQEIGIIAVLSDWAAIETADNVYDWSLLDQSIQFWSSKGKTIRLRFATDTMITNGRLVEDSGCPQWVYDLGVPYMTRDEWGINIRIPDYTHAIYQQKLTEFCQAFADHMAQYDNIECIDVRTYGTWGEWHSGYDYADVATRRQALKFLMDVWVQAFAGRSTKTRFFLSDSYEWRTDLAPNGTAIYDSPAPTYEEYVYNSAFDYGFDLPNVCAERDGIAIAVKEGYDNRHMLEFFRSTRKPLTMEIGGTFQQYDTGQKAGYDALSAIDEALMYHPNYITLMGWDMGGGDPATAPVIGFYNQEKDGMIKYAHMNMGYRLTGTKFSYPSSIAAGQTLAIDHEWINWAMGRLYIPYPVAFYLMQGEKIFWRGVDPSFDQSAMVRGEVYECQSRFTVPTVGLPEGDYDLRVAFVDAQSFEPAILLDMEGGDVGKRYLLGQVSVAAAMAPALPEIESFESGSFTGTKYVAVGAGTHLSFTQQADEVIGGNVSLKAQVDAATQWQDLFYSDPVAMPLAAGGTYKVTFRYRPLANGGGTLDDPAYYYFCARTATGGYANDKGLIHWFDEAGNGPAVKTVILKLENYSDYYLLWGMHWGGSCTVDDVRVTRLDDAAVLHDNFEGGSFASSNYLAGADGGTVDTTALSGSYAVKGTVVYDSSTLSPHWYEFLQSDPGKIVLKRNTSYTVTFMTQQRQASTAEEQMLYWSSRGQYNYFVARTATGGSDEDKGLLNWASLKEQHQEQKTITFVTGDYDDYQLVWGLRNGGHCVVDEIIVIENGPYQTFSALPSFATMIYDGFEQGQTAGEYDTSVWSYGEDGEAGELLQSGGVLSLTPEAGDWKSNLVVTHDYVKVPEGEMVSLKVDVNAVLTSGGKKVRVELGLRNANDPLAYYFSGSAALTCFLSYNGSTASLMVNSKPAGRASNNGAINLQGSVPAQTLIMPFVFELRANATQFEVYVNDGLIASGTHTANFENAYAGSIGVQNETGATGSVSYGSFLLGPTNLNDVPSELTELTLE